MLFGEGDNPNCGFIGRKNSSIESSQEPMPRMQSSPIWQLHQN